MIWRMFRDKIIDDDIDTLEKVRAKYYNIEKEKRRDEFEDLYKKMEIQKKQIETLSEDGYEIREEMIKRRIENDELRAENHKIKIENEKLRNEQTTRDSRLNSDKQRVYEPVEKKEKSFLREQIEDTAKDEIGDFVTNKISESDFEIHSFEHFKVLLNEFKEITEDQLVDKLQEVVDDEIVKDNIENIIKNGADVELLKKTGEILKSEAVQWSYGEFTNLDFKIKKEIEKEDFEDLLNEFKEVANWDQRLKEPCEKLMSNLGEYKTWIKTWKRDANVLDLSDKLLCHTLLSSISQSATKEGAEHVFFEKARTIVKLKDDNMINQIEQDKLLTIMTDFNAGDISKSEAFQKVEKSMDLSSISRNEGIKIDDLDIDFKNVIDKNISHAHNLNIKPEFISEAVVEVLKDTKSLKNLRIVDQALTQYFKGFDNEIKKFDHVTDSARDQMKKELNDFLITGKPTPSKASIEASQTRGMRQ